MPNTKALKNDSQKRTIKLLWTSNCNQCNWNYGILYKPEFCKTKPILRHKITIKDTQQFLTKRFFLRSFDNPTERVQLQVSGFYNSAGSVMVYCVSPSCLFTHTHIHTLPTCVFLSAYRGAFHQHVLCTNSGSPRRADAFNVVQRLAPRR